MNIPRQSTIVDGQRVDFYEPRDLLELIREHMPQPLLERPFKRMIGLGQVPGGKTIARFRRVLCGPWDEMVAANAWHTWVYIALNAVAKERRQRLDDLATGQRQPNGAMRRNRPRKPTRKIESTTRSSMAETSASMPATMARDRLRDERGSKIACAMEQRFDEVRVRNALAVHHAIRIQLNQRD